MKESARILILHASVGAGHTRAAQALEAAFRETNPEAQVHCLDVLELANPVFRKIYADGYLGLARWAPGVLGYLYDYLDRPTGTLHAADSLRSLLSVGSLRLFRKFLREQTWDMIVHTHFLPAEVVAYLRRQGKLQTPHAVVTTDFDAHRLWANLPCEHFFVPTSEGAASLRRWHVAGNDISVTGIPIHPDFSRLPERGRCLKAHGLRGDRPVLLQLAGGFGMGPIEEIYRGMLKTPAPAEIVVITGHNEKVRRKLLRAPVPGRHRSHVLGFTDKMHEFLSVADMVVSKPGGLTTSETLACGAPMAIVQPIPGQESRNCDYLLENGAAVKINNLGMIGEKLEALLSEPERLARMREKALALGKPRAAFEIVHKIFSMLRERRVAQILGLKNLVSASRADVPLTQTKHKYTPNK